MPNINSANDLLSFIFEKADEIGLSDKDLANQSESTNNYEENISDLKQVPDAHKKRLTTNASWLRNTFIKEISDSL